MRAMDLLVDDKVLRVDAEMSRWGVVLFVVIICAGIAAGSFTQERDAWFLWISTGLTLLIGVLAGGWLRHHQERSGLFIPSPWSVVGHAALAIAALFGLASTWPG